MGSISEFMRLNGGHYKFKKQVTVLSSDNEVIRSFNNLEVQFIADFNAEKVSISWEDVYLEHNGNGKGFKLTDDINVYGVYSDYYCDIQLNESEGVLIIELKDYNSKIEIL